MGARYRFIAGSTVIAGAALLLAAPSALAPSGSEAAAATSSGVELVSLSSPDISGGLRSERPSLSADGRYVAFAPAQTGMGGRSGVFVRDMTSTLMVIASQTPTGGNPSWTGSNWGARTPSLSADGRYVAFQSDAINILQPDLNSRTDAYVRDLQLGITTRESLADDDSLMFNNYVNSSGPGASMSSDGNRVVWVHADTSATPMKSRILVRDRAAATTTVASIALNGTDTNGESDGGVISGDGSTVGFWSAENGLVAGDVTNRDVFVRDLGTSSTRQVSVDATGGQANGNSIGTPDLSHDGRFVAFTSSATDLVAGDTNGANDIFVRDMTAGVTTRVSLATNGIQANTGSSNPSISADGRFVAFSSSASTLVPGDTNGFTDVFLHDRLTQVTTRVSVTHDGSQIMASSQYPAISADGSYIAFLSTANGIVTEDTDGFLDAFRVPNTAASVTPIFVLAGQDAAARQLMTALAAVIPEISIVPVDEVSGTFDLPGCPAPSSPLPATISDYESLLDGIVYTDRAGASAGPATPDCIPGAVTIAE